MRANRARNVEQERYKLLKLMETANVSDMNKRPTEVLAMLKHGPVALMSRSEPAAIVVSPEQWNQTAIRLEELERIVENDQRFMEMREDSSKRIPFTMEAHVKRGLIDG